MNTFEILSVLQRIVKERRIFYDVVSSDGFYDSFKRRGDKIIVSNLDSSNKKGSHWILILDLSMYEGKRRRCVQVFDSFGRSFTEFGPYFNCLRDENVTENCIAYQSNDSSSCGSFVLYVIYFRIKGLTLSSVLGKFSNNKKLNEQIVRRFTAKNFGYVLSNGKCNCVDKSKGVCIQSCLAPIDWK